MEETENFHESLSSQKYQEKKIGPAYLLCFVMQVSSKQGFRYKLLKLHRVVDNFDCEPMK